MPDFKSEFADTPDDLVQMKDDAWAGAELKQKRLEEVRKFSNGIELMSKEEAREMGRKRAINYLTFYSKLQAQVSMFQSIVTGTKNLVEIVVDTDDVEKDAVTGSRMSEAINRGALHHRGKFANFWKKCVGEILIAGGVPAVMPPRFGWLPRVEVDMFFPPETDLDADMVPYAFVPKELSYAELQDLWKAAKAREGHYIYKENVKALIKAVKNQIKEGSRTTSGFGMEKTRGARGQDSIHRNSATRPVWEYFEVKYDEESGTPHVSKTIFTTPLQTNEVDRLKRPAKETSSTIVISYEEKAYEDAFEWMQLMVVDSEIGGIKTTDTMRGIAELMYPAAFEKEDLLNLTVDGDKQRAIPKYELSEKADVDSVMKFDMEQSPLLPPGVTMTRTPTGAQHLLTPMDYLDQVESSLTGSPSGRSGSGEKLPDVKNRINVGSEVRTIRINEAINCLENVLEMVVWRLLKGKIKAGTEGYMEAQWVRDYLKGYEIPFEKLAERKNGRFRWIRVRVNRGVAVGDRRDQLETSDWYMANLQNIPPANRPLVLRKALLLRSQDPDEAERLSSVPQVILNQQRVIAENEWDTISRRAAIGQLVSIQPDDVHQLHIPTHLLDMQAHIGKHEHEPWSMLDALAFSGAVEHVGEHLQTLIGNPLTNAEGNQYLQSFQKLVQDAQPIVRELQAQQEQGGGLSAKEQAHLEIEIEKLRLKARELGVREGDLANLQQIREGRARDQSRAQQLRERQQYVNEVTTARKLQLEEQKVAQQNASQEPSTA